MIQDAWKNFEMTGTVADYLTYRQSADYGECAEMKTESLGSERGIGSYGTEHSVQITSDTLSNHILTSADSVSVVILHNHPLSQTFSLEGIRFFLVYSTVAVISVVSNQGTIHYLYKDKQYDFHKAFALFKEFAAKATKNLTVKEHYDIALFFETVCRGRTIL